MLSRRYLTPTTKQKRKLKMQKARRFYAVMLTVIMCITCLVSGTIIADKNTRYMSFGEEYRTVDVRSFLATHDIL